MTKVYVFIITPSRYYGPSWQVSKGRNNHLGLGTAVEVCHLRALSQHRAKWVMKGCC